MAGKENKFQADLVKEIKKRFPGAIVLKNDANYLQGIPDLTILWNRCWAMLECKKSSHEIHQPNQDLYIQMADTLGFGRFIYPENKEAVLDEMERSFKIRR